MSDYRMVIDSACDIEASLLEKWGFTGVDLKVLNKNTEEEHRSGELDINEFYANMKAGTVYVTSAPNTEDYLDAYEKILSDGSDVLCITISSSLSGSCQSATIAASECAEKYPDRKVIVVDSLSGSAGEGMLAYFAYQNKEKGMSIEENAADLRSKCDKIAHIIAVDDLQYLKRGGRISSTSAMAATVLGIKPIIKIDSKGALETFQKVRGWKKALATQVEQYMDNAVDPQNGIYFISHSDRLEDALQLEKLLEEKTGRKAELITSIGSLIGSHLGPGALVLFFITKER